MKKYKVSLAVMFVISILLCSCGKKESSKDAFERTGLQDVCSLAVLECKFNNVAKVTKEKGEGILHIGEKERKYWIEYTGIAKIGVELSKEPVSIDKDDHVTIKMTRAKIIGELDQKFDENSIIKSDDSFWNSNKITVQDQKKAISDAQQKMKKRIENNETLLANAEKRAKALLEKYVLKMGKIAGKDYTVEFEYVDE